jgi:hypothetical protein
MWANRWPWLKEWGRLLDGDCKLTIWQSRGGLCGGVQSGRPRKPLAEVILRSAPLRATSSGLCVSIWRAVRKSFKTQAVWTFDSVGIAYRGKELLRPRKQDRREGSGGATTAGEVGERHFQRQERQERSASASLALQLRRFICSRVDHHWRFKQQLGNPIPTVPALPAIGNTAP